MPGGSDMLRSDLVVKGWSEPSLAPRPDEQRVGKPLT